MLNFLYFVLWRERNILLQSFSKKYLVRRMKQSIVIILIGKLFRFEIKQISEKLSLKDENKTKTRGIYDQNFNGLKGIKSTT